MKFYRREGIQEKCGEYFLVNMKSFVMTMEANPWMRKNI